MESAAMRCEGLARSVVTVYNKRRQGHPVLDSAHATMNEAQRIKVLEHEAKERQFELERSQQHIQALQFLMAELTVRLQAVRGVGDERSSFSLSFSPSRRHRDIETRRADTGFPLN